MDTGYPALITEPSAMPDPQSQKQAAAVTVGEIQPDPHPESSGTAASTTSV